MAQLSFALPPGLSNSGTERQSAGRWRSGNLVRWINGILRPIYGWVQHSPSAVTGSARALIAWTDNASSSWIGVGTHSNLYVMSRAGTLYDITPSGYTTGRADATFGTGYGGGNYGTGTYGTPRPDTTNILEATVWTLDTFGQNLVGVNADDRWLYTWVAPTTGVIAAKVTNAPQCDACFVTAERFLVALASTDRRTVAWSDQQNSTVWTPLATNQAGSFPLQTFGKILCGKRLVGTAGIWTDTDMWTMTYIGGTLVYAFNKVGSGCGAASRQAVAVSDSQAAWMGSNGFFVFDGYVRPLPCDVQDYVFGDINRVQMSKVYAVLNSQYGEVTWFYPSASSTEVDRCVVWSYRDNIWMTHSFGRTCGADASGAFSFSLAIDPADNTVYEHETGFSYSGDTPYVESAPLEFAPIQASVAGEGAKVWQSQTFVPDELLEGDVQATFKAKFFPNGPETVIGPLAMVPQTPTRFSAKQVKLRITGARTDDWRFGSARLDINVGMGDR